MLPVIVSFARADESGVAAAAAAAAAAARSRYLTQAAAVRRQCSPVCAEPSLRLKAPPQCPSHSSLHILETHHRLQSSSCSALILRLSAHLSRHSVCSRAHASTSGHTPAPAPTTATRSPPFPPPLTLLRLLAWSAVTTFKLPPGPPAPLPLPLSGPFNPLLPVLPGAVPSSSPPGGLATLARRAPRAGVLGGSFKLRTRRWVEVVLNSVEPAPRQSRPVSVAVAVAVAGSGGPGLSVSCRCLCNTVNHVVMACREHARGAEAGLSHSSSVGGKMVRSMTESCLLYTSDAADDM
eukprot:1280327-Rhodomonas_salina.5